MNCNDKDIKEINSLINEEWEDKRVSTHRSFTKTLTKTEPLGVLFEKQTMDAIRIQAKTEKISLAEVVRKSVNNYLNLPDKGSKGKNSRGL